MKSATHSISSATSKISRDFLNPQGSEETMVANSWTSSRLK